MQTDKNKWVEEVLGSADTLSRVGAPDMTDRILSHVHVRPAVIGTGFSTMAWRIAASVLLLVALNVGTIYISGSHRGNDHPVHSQDAASIFGLGTTDANQTDLGAVFFGN